MIENIPKGTETILLVEDDSTVRAIVEQMLSHLGYNIIECDLPSKAVVYLNEKANKIDLLLTDVVMPEMSGVELAKFTQKIRPEIPFIFMSGYSDKKILEDNIILPAKNYMQKPFKIEALAVKIREVLE